MSNQYTPLKEMAANCSFCGACHAVCPVFSKLAVESSCARGRLFQARFLSDERLKANEHLAETITKCTLCQACAARCSTGIKTTDIFMRLRKEIYGEVPMPLAKRVAFTWLTYRRLFDACLSFGAPFQSLLFRPKDDGAGHVSRFPIPAAGLNLRRVVPRLASKPLRRLVPEVSRPATGSIKARVAFFPGCMLSYMYPQAGKALLGVLVKNGAEVHIPKKMVCCGTPAITSGDFGVGKVLAEVNVNIMASERYDAIITGCATCATALSHEYGMVLENSPALGKWDALKGKVQDFTTFLCKLGYSKDFRDVKRRVTMHDPCHLVRGMKVSKEPRELVKAIPGVTFVEMADADKCCGCAGSFSAQYYELSRQINDDKIDSIDKTHADLTVTGCSACRMHIVDGLSQRGLSCEVTHTAELIARGYGLSV
ncbi:MAG: (Fe-S)-binding protein [Desulfovibrio sp.]|jgi:glycolate oxidase iron-sulfur subunit|nr:(Fe-S)-binding protein [Desulfovibrio sp.]